MSVKKEKYDFLKHIEKNNDISLKLRAKRLGMNTAFLTGAGLVLATIAIPAKNQILEWGLATSGFTSIIISKYISNSADDLRISIDPKKLRNYLDLKWLENELDGEVYEMVVGKDNDINIGYFLDSADVEISKEWRKLWKIEKELIEMFDAWTFSEHQVKLDGCSHRGIDATMYDLYDELNAKEIPDELKFPVFHEYIREFGTKEQLEFVRKFRKHSAFLPEMSNVVMLKGITYDKIQQANESEGKTRNMNEVNEMTRQAVREYIGCDMEIPYYNLNEVIDRFLEQIVFEKLN